MFFPRRTGSAAWLEARIALFTVGAMLALFGMALRSDRLVALAGLVLAAGLVLRLLGLRRAEEDGVEDAD